MSRHNHIVTQNDWKRAPALFRRSSLFSDLRSPQIRRADVATKDGADGPQRGAAASEHHRGLSEGPGRVHQEVGVAAKYKPGNVYHRRTTENPTLARMALIDPIP